jgi:hypothetical protein
MNSKTSVTFGALAIAAIATLFTSGPILGNQTLAANRGAERFGTVGHLYFGGIPGYPYFGGYPGYGGYPYITGYANFPYSHYSNYPLSDYGDHFYYYHHHHHHHHH